MKQQEVLDEAKKSFDESAPVRDVVRKDREGAVYSPDVNLYQQADALKFWIQGVDVKDINGVDYSMFDFIIAGGGKFSPAAGMTHLDVVRNFYTSLFPFINTVINQFEVTRQELEGCLKNQQDIMDMYAQADMEKKIAEKFIEDNCHIKYHAYKEEVIAEINAT